MPVCQIDDYQDSHEARTELIAWLVNTDAHGLTPEVWARRLEHWWDENPFAQACPARGWVLRYEGAVVGFMGLIPASYVVDGQSCAAYMASTWRVDERHRNASLPMFMKLKRLGMQHLLVDTTPTPEVQLLMQRSGWTACREVRKHFLALGRPGQLLHGRRLPRLAPELRVTCDLRQVTSMAAGETRGRGIEKWVTLEYLRWFVASPMREHVFVGVLDPAGSLSSYLVLTPTHVRGVPAWMAVDHWTCRETPDELHGLVARLLHADLLPSWRLLLSLAAFPGDESWRGMPTLHERTEDLCHYFLLPEALKQRPKRTVLAEGDWGL